VGKAGVAGVVGVVGVVEMVGVVGEMMELVVDHNFQRHMANIFLFLKFYLLHLAVTLVGQRESMAPY
jgi:hypothetical protein